MLNVIPQKSEDNAISCNAAPPTLDKRYLIQLKGKDYVTYAGLLDLAHQHGLASLEVEPVQLPTVENGFECVVRAAAVTACGMIFTDVGDASPGNTNKAVGQHLIRMASTRAKARVLRDMTNVGVTALEELGDDPGDIPGNGNARKKPVKVPGKAMAPEKPVNDNAIVPISDAQKRAIWHLAKSRGYDETTLHDLSESTYGCGVGSLSSIDAASLIKQLQVTN